MSGAAQPVRCAQGFVVADAYAATEVTAGVPGLRWADAYIPGTRRRFGDWLANECVERRGQPVRCARDSFDVAHAYPASGVRPRNTAGVPGLLGADAHISDDTNRGSSAEIGLPRAVQPLRTKGLFVIDAYVATRDGVGLTRATSGAHTYALQDP